MNEKDMSVERERQGIKEEKDRKGEEKNVVIFTDEDGREIPFYVLEQTMIGGIHYLLVTDSDEDEAEAFLLKEVYADGDGEMTVQMVEEDTELSAVSQVFAELMEDVLIEL